MNKLPSTDDVRPGSNLRGQESDMRLFLRKAVRLVKQQLTQGPGRALYGPVRPGAMYSPWNNDAAFMDTYRSIKGYTLVDLYRCFELWSLVAQTAKLEGSLIEVGAWRGGTGALIARKASLCGISAPLYLCDTFTGIVKVSSHDSVYKGGEHADTSRQLVETLMKTLGLSNVKILAGIFPDETAQFVDKDETFRFCHVDVDVYQSAKEVTEWVWAKLVVGGIVVYDDYGFLGCDGVRKCVEEQIARPDRLIIHNLNGHAVIVKIK